jgi:hypothetical protein
MGWIHERFEMKRINHQEAYSLDGACTNQAEEYFSRLRCAEIGIHHHNCWCLSVPLCAGVLMARGQPPRFQWRSGEPHSLAGDEAR